MTNPIQFHADPAELVPVVEELVDRFVMHVVGTEFPPTRRRPIERRDLRRAIVDPSVRELMLVPDAIWSQFEQKEFSPDVGGLIRLSLAHPNKGCLRQSLLAVRSETSDVAAAWKVLVATVKKMTKTGVKVRNLTTGATSTSKTFRYTEGAKALENSGLVMMPIAGTNVIELGP